MLGLAFGFFCFLFNFFVFQIFHEIFQNNCERRGGASKGFFESLHFFQLLQFKMVVQIIIRFFNLLKIKVQQLLKCFKVFFLQNFSVILKKRIQKLLNICVVLQSGFFFLVQLFILLIFSLIELNSQLFKACSYALLILFLKLFKRLLNMNQILVLLIFLESQLFFPFFVYSLGIFYLLNESFEQLNLCFFVAIFILLIYFFLNYLNNAFLAIRVLIFPGNLIVLAFFVV